MSPLQPSEFAINKYRVCIFLIRTSRTVTAQFLPRISKAATDTMLPLLLRPFMAPLSVPRPIRKITFS